jgi:hypothetical protein
MFTGLTQAQSPIAAVKVTLPIVALALRSPIRMPRGGAGSTAGILVDAVSARQARELMASGMGGLPAGVTDHLATVAGRQIHEQEDGHGLGDGRADL